MKAKSSGGEEGYGAGEGAGQLRVQAAGAGRAEVARLGGTEGADRDKSARGAQAGRSSDRRQ